MDELLAGLKAIAETTRIRILFILSHGELNVSELTYILGQSQPRVSRHLKLMAEAGLLSRNKEGNWVLFRLRSEGLSGALARALVEMLPGRDAVLSGDLARKAAPSVYGATGRAVTPRPRDGKPLAVSKVL